MDNKVNIFTLNDTLFINPNVVSLQDENVPENESEPTLQLQPLVHFNINNQASFNPIINSFFILLQNVQTSLNNENEPNLQLQPLVNNQTTLNPLLNSLFLLLQNVQNSPNNESEPNFQLQPLVFSNINNQSCDPISNSLSLNIQTSPENSSEPNVQLQPLEQSINNQTFDPLVNQNVQTFPINTNESNLQLQPFVHSNIINQVSIEPSNISSENFQLLTPVDIETNTNNEELLESLPSCSESGEIYQRLLNSATNDDKFLLTFENTFKILVQNSNKLPQKPILNVEPTPQNQPLDQQPLDLENDEGMKAVRDFEHLMNLFPNEGPPGIHGVLIMTNYDVKKAEACLKFITENRKKKDENASDEELKMEQEVVVHVEADDDDFEITECTINDVVITPVDEASNLVINSQTPNEQPNNGKGKITKSIMRKLSKRLHPKEADIPKKVKKEKDKNGPKEKQDEDDSDSEIPVKQVVKLIPFKKDESNGKNRIIPQETTLKEIYRSRFSQFFLIKDA